MLLLHVPLASFRQWCFSREAISAYFLILPPHVLFDVLQLFPVLAYLARKMVEASLKHVRVREGMQMFELHCGSKCLEII